MIWEIKYLSIDMVEQVDLSMEGNHNKIGTHVGEKVYIPRIIMSPAESAWPFILKHNLTIYVSSVIQIRDKLKWPIAEIVYVPWFKVQKYKTTPTAELNFQNQTIG